MEWKCPERSIRDHNSQNSIRNSLSVPCYSNSLHPHVSSLNRSRGYNLLCHGIWLHFLLSFVGSWNHFLLLSVFLFLFLDFRESLIDYIGEQDIIGPGTCYCESGEREWWYLWPNMILLSTSQSSCWMVARRRTKESSGNHRSAIGVLISHTTSINNRAATQEGAETPADDVLLCPQVFNILHLLGNPLWTNNIAF